MFLHLFYRFPHPLLLQEEVLPQPGQVLQIFNGITFMTYHYIINHQNIVYIFLTMVFSIHILGSSATTFPRVSEVWRQEIPENQCLTRRLYLHPHPQHLLLLL